MVESSLQLDTVFGSLADATRRDILKRVLKRDLSISQIAKPYAMSFAAIAKHVSVLEKAKLVHKRKEGKAQIISARPQTIVRASSYLHTYEKIWSERFDRLEELLQE